MSYQSNSDDSLFISIFKNQLKSVVIRYSDGIDIKNIVSRINERDGTDRKFEDGVNLYEMMILDGVPENASISLIGKYLMGFYVVSNETNATALKMLRFLTESNTEEGDKLKKILEGTSDGSKKIININDLMDDMRRK